MHKNTFFMAKIAPLLMLLPSACQYPVDTAVLPDAQKFIIINAEVTEKWGRLSVKYALSEVNAQGGYLYGTDPVIDKAYITDSRGKITNFMPDGTLDTLFRGVVGETYKLFVQADGIRYESAEETMRPCPEIDSIKPIFTAESFRTARDPYYYGLDAYIYFQDTPGEENFYQWDWTHYERALSCNRRYDSRERRYVLDYCNPVNCWNISYNNKLIVQSDKLREGQLISQKIVRIPFLRPPVKYYLRVEQRSVSPSVFAYLQSIETQTQQAGTLYDIPAQTKFSPNITNPANPKEQILGTFNVFSSRHKIVYIDRNTPVNGVEATFISEPTPFTVDPFAPPAPCVESRFRTQKKPEGWVD